MDKREIKIERVNLGGKGGQHQNRTKSGCRVTHIPTGIQVTINGRKYHQNERAALRELQRRLNEKKAAEVAAKKKARRDALVASQRVVRTYDYSRGIVKDHRSKRKARIKDMMDGKIDLRDFSV